MAKEADVLLMLGRIEGKLDQAIETAQEHREDDKRRFTEVYTKLEEHATDINQAKGAKAAVLWLAGGIAAAVGAVATVAARAIGIQ
jgi:hypothetical protein